MHQASLTDPDRGADTLFSKGGSSCPRWQALTSRTMAVASFSDLCAGFCELADVPAPSLKPDARSVVAFHVILRDVTVNIVYAPERCEDHAFILFEFGPFRGQHADPASDLGGLLDANFLSMQPYPPVFSRNPVNGDALLQYVYPFFEATPTGLLELVERGVQKALRWRQGDEVEQRAQLDTVWQGHVPAFLSGFA